MASKEEIKQGGPPSTATSSPTAGPDAGWKVQMKAALAGMPMDQQIATLSPVQRSPGATGAAQSGGAPGASAASGGGAPGATGASAGGAPGATGASAGGAPGASAASAGGAPGASAASILGATGAAS